MSIARRSLQVVAFVATLIVALTSIAVIVTQTAWFKDWLRGFIVRQSEDFVNGRLSIGRLDGNLFFGVEFGDVDVAMNGEPVVQVADLGLRYNIFSFLGGDVVIDDIRLTRPVIRLARTEEGWNLARLIKTDTPDPDRPRTGRSIRIDEIGISDGTLYIDDAVGIEGVEVPRRVERLDASLGVSSDENRLTVEIGHLSLQAVDPAFGVRALSGTVQRTTDEVRLEQIALQTEESELRVNGAIAGIETERLSLQLTAASERLAFAEIARLVPALRGYQLQPAFEISAEGPADRLAVNLDLREPQVGTVAADLTVDALAPGQRVAGRATLTRINVAPLLPPQEGAASASDPITSDVSAQVAFDFALPEGQRPLSGTYSVNAPRVLVAGYGVQNLRASGRIDGEVVRVDASANAYGGRATVVGTVRTGEPRVIDVSGRATNLDLRNLPAELNVPGVASNLNVTYELAGRGDVFSGRLRFDPSSLANASIAEGTSATFEVGGGAPRYTATGQIADLDLQQIGEGFEITALASDRFSSRINASFDVSGSGGGEHPLAIDATGTLTGTEIFGARFPSMTFAAQVADGDVRVQTDGRFENLNPGTVADNPRLAGVVNGAVDLETTIRDYAAGVTVDSIDAAGRIMLEDSNVGNVSIVSAIVDGQYANREGTLETFELTGPDVNARAQGTISLTETGASDLTVHLDTASLDRIGEIVEQPLKGAAVVEARITGNARELTATGTLKGSDLGHGDNEALSLSSDFTVVVPELTPADARVEASTMATFVQVAGQRITELSADVTYAQPRLEFTATAQEGNRELDAGGSVVFLPDEQEIHLPNLALRTEGVEWRTPPDSDAVVRYSSTRIGIEDIELVNGTQRITADGVLGSTEEPLLVRLDGIDVAEVDRLLLGDQRISGTFSAEAMVTGPMSEPDVEADFTLTGGAFRDYTFESFAGAVEYRKDGVTLDVRLQQSPTEWLTATGTAPMTLFQPNPEGVTGHREPSPGDTVDIAVASSQIELGVVQGFTSLVTDVTGTLQADLRVTGSGYDPHVNGTVRIAGGAFDVPEYGTAYTGLDTTIELNPQGITIQEFRILDDRGFPMTVGGTLAFHAREVGAVDVRIVTDRFEVIDNQLADIKLNSDVRITGEIRRPRIEGRIDVENGTIHVARLLEQVTADPYATEAATLGPEGVKDDAAGEEEPEPSVFDALTIDLAVNVPNNLVIRGQDIRAANAPIALGDMNVTVGGKLQVQKEEAEPIRLIGTVNTVRGTYTFQGRRFDIMRDGQIGFSGGEEIDPRLDIRARRVISGIETFVNVRGTLRAPELAFSSNPPQDEGDILALIIFNQPMNQLGEGQQVSLAERAGALAGGYLTSGLSRSIASALDLDEFEIQATGEAGAGPSITLGEQVGRNLFFRLRQGFGSQQTTELILEYQIAEFLRAQGSVAEGSAAAQRIQFRRVERAGLDLIFFFSY
jgi:uncharacterized protein involved in outer membrane biogenesis